MYISIIFIGSCICTVCIIFGLQELKYIHGLLNTGKKYRCYSWQLDKRPHSVYTDTSIPHNNAYKMGAYNSSLPQLYHKIHVEIRYLNSFVHIQLMVN